MRFLNNNFMEITDIKIKKINSLLSTSRVKAYISLLIDNCIVINDIKIIEGNKGLFVQFPTRIRKDGVKVSVAFPNNEDTRRIIVDKILQLYNA